MIDPIELRGVKMKKEYIKPFTWGMAVGMVVLLIVIFSAGWVVTSGSAGRVILSCNLVPPSAPITTDIIMMGHASPRVISVGS